MNDKNKNAIIGYSGHAYVVIDTIESLGSVVYGYFDKIEKDNNPYHLEYLGDENDPKSLEILKSCHWFVAIGDNRIRQKVTESVLEKVVNEPMSLFHKNSVKVIAQVLAMAQCLLQDLL